jgi:hypothetical protein
MGPGKSNILLMLRDIAQAPHSQTGGSIPRRSGSVLAIQVGQNVVACASSRNGAAK